MQIIDRLSLLRGQDLVLGTLLERLSGVHGSRRLVEEAHGGLCLTVAEAADLVARWAGGIAAATDPGDVVVVATPNGYEQVLLSLAAARAGRVPAPVNAQMTASEVEHVVADSAATLRIGAAADVEGHPPVDAAPAQPDAVAALFYTSGTTGKPKGAQLTHRGLLGGLSGAVAYPAALRPAELVLALPVAHIYGFAMVLGAACAGVPVYFLPRFHPVEVLDAIEGRQAALFAGVPAMYRMMLEAGAADRDLKSVRLWMSGADAMPADLAARFKRFGATVSLPLIGPVGEAAWAEGYGMVETGGGVAVRVSPPMVPARLGSSFGMPLPGYSFRVVDEAGEEVGLGAVGQLLIRGPGILEGYHGDAAATASALTEDGWLRSGDLARRGLLGTVSFEGRAKDVIKRGGYSVYAVEVEQAIEEHADVVEAAVVALPDERDGEVPACAVRLRDGVALADVDLAEWAALHLSSYKVPARFVAVDDLPRTGTDKLQRGQLVELFAAEDGPARGQRGPRRPRP